MGDNGLDWVWTRTEFRKALLACTNAANDGDLSEGVGLLPELCACSLLILNFRHRLSSKQQRDLRKLAAACELRTECYLGTDDDHEFDESITRHYDESITRHYVEDAIKHARASSSLFEGI